MVLAIGVDPLTAYLATSPCRLRLRWRSSPLRARRCLLLMAMATVRMIAVVFSYHAD